MSLQQLTAQTRPRTVLLLFLVTGCLWVSSLSTVAQANSSSDDKPLRQGVPGRRVSGGTR